MPKTLRSPAHKLLVDTLKAARKSAQLSQEEVAARLGRPQSFVAKIETGERRLDVIEFLALAKVLALDPSQVIQTLSSRLGQNE